MKRMMVIPSPMRRGENTHHQEMLITPKSLRMRRMRKITVPNPRPEPLLLLLDIIFSCLVNYLFSSFTLNSLPQKGQNLMATYASSSACAEIPPTSIVNPTYGPVVQSAMSIDFACPLRRFLQTQFFLYSNIVLYFSTTYLARTDKV